MLENWCFEEEVLKKVSKHYRDGTQLPDELIKGIRDRSAKSLFYVYVIY
jgi:Zn-dependent oligopeptidase